MAVMRCFVSGRVQGVFFRASTRDKARQLGLAGRASNLPDGRVEVIASGPEADLAALRRWLRLTFFRGDSTRCPVMATAILVIASRP